MFIFTTANTKWLNVCVPFPRTTEIGFSGSISWDSPVTSQAWSYLFEAQNNQQLDIY